MNCSYFDDLIGGNGTFFHLSHKNIKRLLCCLAESHIVIQSCIDDDFYRLDANTYKNIKLPTLFLPDGVVFQNKIDRLDTVNSNQGKIIQSFFEFYVLTTYDIRNQNRSKLDQKELTFQAIKDIINRFDLYTTNLRKYTNNKWWLRTFKLIPISEYDNEERWAKNLVGYKAEMIVEGIDDYNDCDGRFIDLFCDSCNNRLIAERCCDFTAELEFNGGIQVNVVLNDNCQDFGFTYEFRVNNVIVQEGNDNYYETEILDDTIYDIIIRNGDCEHILSYSNPPINCCEYIEITVTYNEDVDTIIAEFEWLDFMVQCRFSIIYDNLTSYVFQKFNENTETWELYNEDNVVGNIIYNPEPGKYRFVLKLTYGCEIISDTVVINGENCCDDIDMTIRVTYENPGSGGCIEFINMDAECNSINNNGINTAIIRPNGTSIVIPTWIPNSETLFCVPTLPKINNSTVNISVSSSCGLFLYTFDYQNNQFEYIVQPYNI